MSAIHANTHWNLVVSYDTDMALRQFLANQGSGYSNDISHFVEEAVRAHILDLTALAAKTENAIYSQPDIENAIDEALAWARH